MSNVGRLDKKLAIYNEMEWCLLHAGHSAARAAERSEGKHSAFTLRSYVSRLRRAQGIEDGITLPELLIEKVLRLVKEGHNILQVAVATGMTADDAEAILDEWQRQSARTDARREHRIYQSKPTTSVAAAPCAPLTTTLKEMLAQLGTPFIPPPDLDEADDDVPCTPLDMETTHAT